MNDTGFEVTLSPSQADLILLNTCAVREKAHERIYSRLQSFSHLKRAKPELVVGILGCMAQNLGEDLFALGLPLDLIVGPDNYRKLPELIERARSERTRVNLTRLSYDETYQEIEPMSVNGPLAFITIMRGCNNFCSFCVVPFTRGRERSRPPESIVDELNHLIIQNKVREVTLLGQNVNSYRHEDTDFTGLVRRILDETDVKRIRFTSPHPHDFPVKLLELMALEKRFCSQIHMPVQSGSTDVLARMKRDYTREEFISLTDLIRSIIPDAGLTTDIITGFPGETEEDFEQTLSLVEAVQFDLAYMFRYSEREGTSAKKKFIDDVPEETKLDRLNRLISVQRGISFKKNKEEIGKIRDILIEGASRKSAREWMGRSESGRVSVFPAMADTTIEEAMGRIVPVKIVSSSSATLRAEYCEILQISARQSL